jgi:hypothetical protein
MKKVLYFAALLFCAALTSCEKEEIGGTATESMAGDWYVTFDAADENGNVYVDSDGDAWTDPFGVGQVHVATYNTAANTGSELIVDDLGSFWEFKVKASCDQQGLTFQTNTSDNNNMVADYEDINVTITGGKILPKAGHQKNGSPADSIVFYVSFSDDDYSAAYGYAKYKVSGIRYSGLEEND